MQVRVREEPHWQGASNSKNNVVQHNTKSNMKYSYKSKHQLDTNNKHSKATKGITTEAVETTSHKEKDKEYGLNYLWLLSVPGLLVIFVAIFMIWRKSKYRHTIDGLIAMSIRSTRSIKLLNRRARWTSLWMMVSYNAIKRPLPPTVSETHPMNPRKGQKYPV